MSASGHRDVQTLFSRRWLTSPTNAAGAADVKTEHNNNNSAYNIDSFRRQSRGFNQSINQSVDFHSATTARTTDFRSISSRLHAWFGTEERLRK